jgi:hypothetical protein
VPVGTRLSFMATLKPFQLSVTLGATAIRFPYARRAEICRDETVTLPYKIKDGSKVISTRTFGYRFIKYSGDLYSVEEAGLHLEDIANEVLKLITPARKLTQEERDSFGLKGDFSGWLALDDLDPEEVVNFLNNFGMVGLGNYDRRNALNQVRTPKEFISKVGIPYKYLPVLEKAFKQDPMSLFRRISRIVKGDEIPFKWIEDDLRILAKCIRMIVALDQNEELWQEQGEIPLKPGKSLRRMTHAWSPVFAIPDHRDPGDFLPTNELWIHSNPEFMVQDFVSSMNTFLKPLSSNAILTERTKELQDENFGLETALVSYLFLNKTNRLIQKPCKYPKCGKLFFPVRVTKEFCSDTCGTNDRVARKRIRDRKISAPKAGSSKRPKVEKEKK